MKDNIFADTDKKRVFIPVIVKFLLFPFYIRVKSLTLQTDK